MTRHAVLIDTGPIVAVMRQDDAHHEVCKQELARLAYPLYTCWPVLTEAAWLLRKRSDQLRRLISCCGGDPFQLLALADEDLAGISAILEKYEDQGFQLADAALMYLADRERIGTVFTLDRKDFLVYRTTTHQPLELIPLL